MDDDDLTTWSESSLFGMAKYAEQESEQQRAIDELARRDVIVLWWRRGRFPPRTQPRQPR